VHHNGGMPNSPTPTLSDAERNLIARCQIARNRIPGLAQLGNVTFWFQLVLGVIYTIAVVGLYVAGNPAAADAASFLFPFWMWILVCFVAARTLRFEQEAVELICKLTGESEK